MTRALLAIDCQVDFTTGSLGTGCEVAERIRQHIQDADAHGFYTLVVATKDWHIRPGIHWSNNPDYLNSFPKHCEAGSPGAELDPALLRTHFDDIFFKGMLSPSYSGFDAMRLSEGEARLELLGDYLRRHEVDEVDVVGYVVEFCISATALDAIGQGFTTHVLQDLCSGIKPDSTKRKLEELAGLGIDVLGSPS